MNRWVGRLGAGFLALFCAAGLAAWATLPGHVTLVLSEDGAGPASRAPTGDPSQDLLLEELGALEVRTQERLDALEDRLGAAFGALEAPFQELLDQGTAQAGQLRDLELQLAELQGRIHALQELRLVLPSAGPDATPDVAMKAGPPAEAEVEVPAEDAPPDTAGDAAQETRPVSFTQLFQRAEQTPRATGPVRFVLVPGGSKVGFDGSSNLHDFSGSTTQVEGELSFLPGDPEEDPSAWIHIRAPDLVTGEDGRDEEMHEHYLESARYPEISFRLTSLSDVVEEGGRVFTATGHGDFLCHGVTKEVTVPVKVERIGTSTVRVTGEWRMLMSDHGIAPPKALGGLITTADEVLAWFHLQARAQR